MLMEHSAEMSLVKKESIWKYTKNISTHFYTLMETLGAVCWMYFNANDQLGIGALCLIIGLSIEHIIQGADLKRKF